MIIQKQKKVSLKGDLAHPPTTQHRPCFLVTLTYIDIF